MPEVDWGLQWQTVVQVFERQWERGVVGPMRTALEAARVEGQGTRAGVKQLTAGASEAGGDAMEGSWRVSEFGNEVESAGVVVTNPGQFGTFSSRPGSWTRMRNGSVSNEFRKCRRLLLHRQCLQRLHRWPRPAWTRPLGRRCCRNNLGGQPCLGQCHAFGADGG